jgi:hypothetical protein
LITGRRLETDTQVVNETLHSKHDSCVGAKVEATGSSLDPEAGEIEVEAFDHGSDQEVDEKPS